MTADEASSGALYRRLLRYSAPHWKVFAGAIVAMAVFAGVDSAFISLIKPFLDGSFVDRDAAVIRWAPPAILGLFIVRGVAHLASTYGMAWVSQRVVLQLRAEVFDQLLRLPVAHYDQVRNADLVVKLTYHCNQIADTATGVVTAVFKDGLTILGLVAVMFWISWELALVALTVAPLVAASVRYVNRRFKTISQRLQASMGGITHVADEAISGRRVVRLYGGEAYEAARFRKVSDFLRSQAMKMAANGATSSALVQAIAAVAIAMVVHLAITGQIASPGAFVAFMGALLALRGPLNSVTSLNERIARGQVAARDLFAFLDQPREAAGGTRPLARARGALAFEGVHFRYPSAPQRPVLQDVSLAIEPGQTVAFVGRSGSGKSTLLSLVPRFYDPAAGRLTLDGHDLREYPLDDLRRQIALVDQNVVLFNGTVAENIAYGRREATAEAQIVDAARAAYAWDFIEKLPQGLETMLGQNGVNLSGGQRQRIAIARALLRDAPILILDEATSALDTESERYIQQALDRLVAGRTTLVIAHRLSTVQRADLIVVMKDGRIVETGRHAELLERDGLYATLHAMQFEDTEPAGT